MISSPPTLLHLSNSPASEMHLAELLNKLRESELQQTIDYIAATPALEKFLISVMTCSPYLRDLLLGNVSALSEILACGYEKFCANVLQETKSFGLKISDEKQMMRALRNNKARIALACALADLGGWWASEKVTTTLAQFADASLCAAIDYIFLQASRNQHFELSNQKTPQNNCGLIALAMGKHGAFELNYSSDIDLILFYDSNAAERVIKTDPTTFFSRVAKQLVKLLQERTSDGYVFRVDLRLRPDPASTPPIMPVEAGLIYYESYGQNWERAALIKARPCAGDIDAGKLLLKELTPFIWRKYLDYAAIQDVHSIKRQIHAHKGHASIATRGHNIKLGRGGIREIEFFAQTQQLIAGGRMPGLRTTRTIETLQVLCAEQWIDQHAVDELTTAYWYLRNVEHRLQMVRDEQTHSLPSSEEEFANIAIMMGCENVEKFTSELIATLQTVERHYSSLFESSQELSSASGNLVFTGDGDDPETIETLQNMGYERPSDIIRTIKGWHFGRLPALRNAQARELLTELTPQLLQEFSRTGRADDTLIAFDRFIAGLPAGIQLFALLNSNPPLQNLLTILLSAAPRLSDIITRRPHVFDGLLDPSFNTTLTDKTVLEERLIQYLSKSPDYETMLDHARIFAAEQKFLIGVRLINGTINAVQAGHAFSELAQVMINEMLERVRLAFENIHGKIDGGAVCVLAMGRLGSRELTAGSDLDLIFLYDHHEDAPSSDGNQPLHPSQYFTRLTQRLTSAMCAPTAQGVIYELDFRLRPSGNAGPLATHTGSFFKYQKNQAWTWERQALTRARPIAGSLSHCEIIDKKIENLFVDFEKTDALEAEIADMRETIDKAKGSANPWNVKSVKGGLIDIEFIAQWMVLKTGALPKTSKRNTRQIIRDTPLSLLTTDTRNKLLLALEMYTNILQLLRACLDDEFNPETSPTGLTEIMLRTLGLPDLAGATLLLREHQKTVSEIFTQLLGEPNPKKSRN